MKETEKANKDFKIWYALNRYLQNSLLLQSPQTKPNQTLVTSSYQVTFSKDDKAQKYPDVERTPFQQMDTSSSMAHWRPVLLPFWLRYSYFMVLLI